MERKYGLPKATGLYDPNMEHDACGVGFVVDIKGRKSHDIIRQALQVLDNLTHRGACGCDPETGDGAGILFQVPHEFFKVEAAKLGFKLPEAGFYGVGMMFLPVEEAARKECEATLEEIIAEEGQELLGWRDVPVNLNAIGHVARDAAPVIRQVFVGRRGEFASDDDFEKKLYFIRKRANYRLRFKNRPETELYYACSFSSRTIIYKGMLISYQMDQFFSDLKDPAVTSSLGLVHSRFSTNTFPSWELAHPYRMVAHNGEINTVRGNRNWMTSRFASLKSDALPNIDELRPIVTETGSDSAALDNALEFFVMGGRDLPHAVTMMVPEAWTGDPNMEPAKRAYYEYHACLMEPWDGPAAICFTDGVQIGATLDRNGLRPGRYWVMKDGRLIFASETGVLDEPADGVVYKGKMQPGRMLLVDTAEGRLIGDEELKARLASRQNYSSWIRDNVIELDDIPDPAAEKIQHAKGEKLLHLQQAFGYTLEDLRILMAPMGATGMEALGSMGTDTPLAVLSDRPQLLYGYFKQLFAQVTNPPIDSIREELVMSTWNYLGRMHNILDETPKHCHLVRVKHVVLTNEQLEKIRSVGVGDFQSVTLPMVFDPAEGESGLETALDDLLTKAEASCRNGANIIILSDRDVDANHAPIPALLATAGLHHHLIRAGLRGNAGIVVETGEAREVMHFALLIGYGAGAINPYLAFETLDDMIANNQIPAEFNAGDITLEKAIKNYTKAVDKAILKVIAKMGISTVQSYQAAQIFEAIGLNKSVIDKYFTWTASRIQGVGLETIAREVLLRHSHAYPEDRTAVVDMLDQGGQYYWRRNG